MFNKVRLNVAICFSAKLREELTEKEILLIQNKNQEGSDENVENQENGLYKPLNEKCVESSGKETSDPNVRSSED